MAWLGLPTDDFDYETKRQFPAERFGLFFRDLFPELYKRYNTTQLYMQELDAFYLDVVEVAWQSEDLADLHTRLKKKSTERQQELVEMMQLTGDTACGGYMDRCWNNRHLFQFDKFWTRGSLDSLIEFFMAFAGPDRRGRLPHLTGYPQFEMPQGFVPDFSARDARRQATMSDYETSDSEAPSLPGAQIPGFPIVRTKKRRRTDDDNADSIASPNHKQQRLDNKEHKERETFTAPTPRARIIMYSNSSTQTEEETGVREPEAGAVTEAEDVTSSAVTPTRSTRARRKAKAPPKTQPKSKPKPRGSTRKTQPPKSPGLAASSQGNEVLQQPSERQLRAQRRAALKERG